MNKLRFHQDNTSLKELGLYIKNKKTFEGTQTTWNQFLKPAVIVAAPVVGMAVAAKSKKFQVG